jgi:hypothetical protein
MHGITFVLEVLGADIIPLLAQGMDSLDRLTVSLLLSHVQQRQLLLWVVTSSWHALLIKGPIFLWDLLLVLLSPSLVPFPQQESILLRYVSKALPIVQDLIRL